MEQFYQDVIYPLVRSGKFQELFKELEKKLAEVTEKEIRCSLLGLLASFHATDGDASESWRRQRQMVEEYPDDPLAQNGMSKWHYYNSFPEHNLEDLAQALDYSAVAVEKARTSNAWRRNVLHDRCRIATAAGRFDIVAEAMEEILEVWADPCEPDIPMFEWDWLDDLPSGALDADLMARFQGVVDGVLEYRRRRDAGIPVLLEIDCFTRDGNGAMEPFSLSITEPVLEKRGFFRCVVTCPLIAKHPFNAQGDEDAKTFGDAVELIEAHLKRKGLELVDRDGDAVQLGNPYAGKP